MEDMFGCVKENEKLQKMKDNTMTILKIKKNDETYKVYDYLNKGTTKKNSKMFHIILNQNKDLQVKTQKIEN